MYPFTDDSSLSTKCHNYKNKSKFTCIPIGLTQGQFNLNAFKIPVEFKWFQMRSACLMAFCHLHTQNPLNWTSYTINTILINGAKVVKDNYNRVEESTPLDCVLNIENCIVKIRIDEPFVVTTVDSNAALVDTLRNFFEGHQHGLFRCMNLCYLMWKTNGIYFLFDAQGNGSGSEDKNGFASLVCTESIKDVSKLLRTISSMQPDDCYSISPIKLKHFRRGVSDNTKPRIYYAGTNTYTIVNDSFAILSGKFHIGHNGFQPFKQRQSLPVGLMALIYNEIQPPNSWNSQLIDKIILLGTRLFTECKKTPQGEVTIQHLPHEYRVLKYKFKIDYKPYVHSGQMSYSLDEMSTNLLMYLQRAFTGAAKKSVLIQTNTLAFAVWECDNFYYLFDAYARNQQGEVCDERLGTPCVHMHNSLESLCSVLCTNLNAIASNDGFVMHGVDVTLERPSEGKVDDDDLETINTFMDDQFWMEMSNFRESSARSEEICNLDETSDDDIFLETVGGLKRATSSVASTNSGSTTSSLSKSDASQSGTDTSAKESDSTGQSNVDSESQISKENETKSKSKSPKKRKGNLKEEKDEEVVQEQSYRMSEIAEKKNKKQKKSKSKVEKNKLEIEVEQGDVYDDRDADGADQQSEKKSRQSEKKTKKSSNEIVKNESKQSLVVVESSSGTETSIVKLLTTSFKISDRVLLVTEWGDFFVAQDNDGYFLCDGCLCDYDALIQINFTDLDSSTRLENIDGVVEKIMHLKDDKNVTINLETNDLAPTNNEIDGITTIASSGDVDASFWELIEGMIELMKTTAKFDKIKEDLI